MPVLVTGGLGHIGSWVCHELVKRGQSVIVTGRSHRRVSYLEGMEKQIKFVPADVVDQASIYRLFADQKGAIEGVVHIAGLMGGPFFASNPRHHIYTNTMGTVDMLEASRVFGVRRFVYISSGAVYGVRDDIPREDEPMTPGDLYGAAKAGAEFFGLQYANEFGLDFRALRVYFAYGPGRYPSELYPLYRSVFGPLEGKNSISLPAGADQSVDFTYLKDIARAVCLMWEAGKFKAPPVQCVQRGLPADPGAHPQGGGNCEGGRRNLGRPRPHHAQRPEPGQLPFARRARVCSRIRFRPRCPGIRGMDAATHEVTILNRIPAPQTCGRPRHGASFFPCRRSAQMTPRVGIVARRPCRHRAGNRRQIVSPGRGNLPVARWWSSGNAGRSTTHNASPVRS